MRDTRYEGWLTDLRCSWEYIPTVHLESINQAESLRNQARLGPTLDADVVREYAENMERGIKYPALIAWKKANGEYVLITGNHRLQALRDAKISTTDLYHITDADTDHYLRDVLTRTANTVEGKTISKDERLAQAAYIVQVHGRNVQEVAMRFGLGRDQLQAEMTRMRYNERASKLGVPTNVTSGVKSTVGKIQNDLVFANVIKTVQEGKIPDPEVREIVRLVTQEGTQETQLAALAQYRASPTYVQRARETLGGRTQIRLSASVRMFSLIESLDRLLVANPTPGALGLTNTATIDRLNENWGKLSFAMQKVLRDGRNNIASAIPITPSESGRPSKPAVAAR